MARIIKMSIAASSECMADANIEMPDAIITGTALGCLEDTEKFLKAILENNEQFLTPTSFIQSTHNTVSAQIALQLQCKNYNFTYVHKGFSFESSVLDAMMNINEGSANNILVGGHDEMTEKYYRVCNRIDYWKKEDTPTMQLIKSDSIGSIAGEGAAFFMFGKEKTENTYAKVSGIKTVFKPEGEEEIQSKINEFLKEQGLSPADVDVVLYGYNGDSRFDPIYRNIEENIFSNATSTYYKHLCGEYQTSTAFAMYLAAQMIGNQNIPNALLKGGNKSKTINNVLIYNTFLNIDHSMFLLTIA